MLASNEFSGCPSNSAVKNPPANAGDVSSIPGSGRSPGEGNGNPLSPWGHKRFGHSLATEKLNITKNISE